jgi:phage-related protein
MDKDITRVTCYYYITASGSSPVREFIDSLNDRSQRKFFFVKALLEEFGYRLPYPHVKYLRDSIFELRFKGIEGEIRVLYFFFQRGKVIFTNGFIKKSGKTPKNELSIAMSRRNEFLNQQYGGD